MAYEVPHQWVRGDAVTAARMNAYSNGQNAIEALSSIASGNEAFAYDRTDSDDNFTFQHTERFLRYRGNGTIINMADTTQTVGITEIDNEWATYDLDSIGWMYYGAYYMVDGPDGCTEHFLP